MSDDLVEFLRNELLELLQDSEVRSRIVDEAAEALPLPDFVERRVLGILYGAMIEAAKNAPLSE